MQKKEFNISYALNLSEGEHGLHLVCEDSAGNIREVVKNIFVDLHSPEITALYPPDGALSYYPTLNFTFNFTDNMAENGSCTLYLNETHGNLTIINFSISNSSIFSLTVNFSESGNYTWWVTCRDMADNPYTTPLHRFMINLDLPKISLILPSNETIFPPYTTQFILNLSTSIPAFCKLDFLPGIEYTTMSRNFTTINLTHHTITLKNLSNNQTLKLYVKCSNLAGFVWNKDLPLIYYISYPRVVFNEIMVRDVEENDWIELYNLGETEVNLKNWSILHSPSPSSTFIFNSSLKLYPRSYYLLYRNSTGIELNESSGMLTLRERYGEVLDTLSYHAWDFNSSWTEFPENTSVGRNIDGTGNWSILKSPTPGYTNLGYLTLSFFLTHGWNLVSIYLSLI